jgi:hypothetical protein
MGAVFGVITLVISLMIGLAVYQKNKTTKTPKVRAGFLRPIQGLINLVTGS